ncbi:general secretion pathway protein GspD [Aquabacterium sp. A7-Y]|uniref:secretin and TonB N-terminal domain-containing protein n=1 Tax=Aquabacterium sp. A7-Y TaxID=1349605 RepID=UPI00223CC18D|nr:secretin and TonB N-terminal domain-containing protein [Aquabacterium sp. A7-Y]MCW7541273.1 general secretion pathway protein GspD [Aquabacterium sp. A7-Y]
MAIFKPTGRMRRNRRRGASGRPGLAWSGVALLGSLLAGCAGHAEFRSGRADIAAGQDLQGVAKLRQASLADPANVEYRRTYFEQRDRALDDALRRLDALLEAGRFAEARAELATAAGLAANDPRVVNGAERIAGAERHASMLDKADGLGRQGRVDEALALVRQVLSEQPQHRRARLAQRQWLRAAADLPGQGGMGLAQLSAAYRKPVTLSFVNASLLQVFESLKLASGLNFMFDRDVPTDRRVTLSVNNKSVEDVLRLLLATQRLERRVLDQDTVLIYPNSPEKTREYQELVTRSFYLSNADVTKAAALVKGIAKARDVFIDEALNLMVVRDSAEVVRLVEKLLANHDLAEPEVMLELEVLEVATNRLTELGIRWPDSVSASIAGRSGEPGVLSLPEARNVHSGMVQLQFNDPLVAAQLRSQKGDSTLLANPRIRVRNRQSAKVLIGERVPVITTTSAVNVGTLENVNYLDVGLKLDIEPTVSLEDEVGMKVSLEVSNILETITRNSGTQAYRLGTRNASTQLRVRDGETQVLAGLIQRDERRSNTGVPGLNEIPLVNKLFGQGSNNDTRTEIVLLITPRVVRNIQVPGPGQIEFLSGTEAANGAASIQLRPAEVPGGRPGQPRAPAAPPASPSAGPPGQGAPQAPAPAGPGGSSAPVLTPGFTPPPLVPN